MTWQQPNYEKWLIKAMDVVQLKVEYVLWIVCKIEENLIWFGRETMQQQTRIWKWGFVSSHGWWKLLNRFWYFETKLVTFHHHWAGPEYLLIMWNGKEDLYAQQNSSSLQRNSYNDPLLKKMKIGPVPCLLHLWVNQ